MTDPDAPEFRPALPRLMACWPYWQVRTSAPAQTPVTGVQEVTVEVARLPDLPRELDDPAPPVRLVSRPLTRGKELETVISSSDPFLPLVMKEGERLVRPVELVPTRDTYTTSTRPEPVSWDSLAHRVAPGRTVAWYEAPEIPFTRGLPDLLWVDVWDAWHHGPQTGPHHFGLWERLSPSGESSVVRLRVGPFRGLRVDMPREGVAVVIRPGDPMFREFESSRWRPLVSRFEDRFPRPVPWSEMRAVPGYPRTSAERLARLKSLDLPAEFRVYCLRREDVSPAGLDRPEQPEGFARRDARREEMTEEALGILRKFCASVDLTWIDSEGGTRRVSVQDRELGWVPAVSVEDRVEKVLRELEEEVRVSRYVLSDPESLPESFRRLSLPAVEAKEEVARKLREALSVTPLHVAGSASYSVQPRPPAEIVDVVIDFEEES